MLKFRPILKSPIWSGDRLAAYKGVAFSTGSIGESWEISGLRDNESVVAEGPMMGLTLTEVIRREGAALLGAANYARFGVEFPLLVKFIDARHDLSVQVHPDDALARQHHDSRGKTEMWYVVAADEGASLRVGFHRSVTPEEYERAVADHTILDLMSEYAVAEGDVFFLPSGRIHTIGAGSLLVEIQQPSDITYRIYDYGRIGADGKPRELHTELARQALDFAASPDCRLAYQPTPDCGVELVHCDHFTTRLYDLTADYDLDLSSLDSFVVLVCTKGRGRLIDDRGEVSTMRQGETVLVPANVAGLKICLETLEMTLLASYIE